MKHSSKEIRRQLQAAAPQLRTVETMLQDMRSQPRAMPDAATQAQVKRFRPTMPAQRYEALKARQKVKLEAGLEAQESARPLDAQAAARARTPVVLVGPNFQGATDVDRLYPPDTHGAIGLDHFVEITNSHIDIFDRTDPARRTSISLAAFIGYAERILFDPRVVYDSIWNRWIVTAEAFPESPTLQWHFIAVSTTPDPLGSYFIYAVNVTLNEGDFWDFPQLGVDQDAVIVTANVFTAEDEFRSAYLFAVAKARLYNGLDWLVPAFTDLAPTLAPPIVLDQNARTFLVSAAPEGDTLSLYTLTNASRPDGTELAGPVEIPVPAYTVPPPAPQPGTDVLLDTSDARFVNASTQVGNYLWQVHTVDLAGFATPRFYQIDAASGTLVQSTFFYGTATSFDFNASIAANQANDIFVTWTLTDPANGTQAQVRFSGFDHGDGPSYVLGPGQAAFTSPTWYGRERWGDYSAVTLDPRNGRRAWLVNEESLENHDWGSRIAGIGFED